MKTQLSMTTIPAESSIGQCEITFEEKVQQRRKLEEAKKEEQRQDQAEYRARHRNEHLLKKVERLARKHWLGYDAIRWEVEASLPLANPTPAQIRDYREQIARLVNQYRQNTGWK